MNDKLIAAVARAILETDPTCDYEKCREQFAHLPDDHIQKNWWEDLHEKARAAIAEIRANGHVIVPARNGANIITGHSPLDLSDIEPIGEGAIYIDGLTLDEAGLLLKVQT